VKWVSTDWLADQLAEKNPTHMILDTQPDIHDYIAEHIPEAIYFNPKLLRVPYYGRPGVYIPEGAVESLFRRIGLRAKTPVVVYTGKGAFKGWGDGLEQTMIAYSLVRFGHQNVFVLDGGLDKWKAEDKPLTKKFPEVKPSDFTVNVQSQHVLDMEEVRDMKDRNDVLLLDARPANAYEGQGPWIKPGHIPGAVNLPWKAFMQDNPTMLKPKDDIHAILKEEDATPDKTIICSCGTGREATNEFILFKWFLGYPSVKIYEGSFTEWSSYPENPTVTGKNPY
jgi:thiosulfate/3-mercaptopyruvate sulfurtransferase